MTCFCSFPNLRNCQLEPDGNLVPPFPQRTNVCKTLRHCRTIYSFFFYKPPSNVVILLFFRLSFQYQKQEVQRVLQSWFQNNISAGHTSLLQVYRCYWTYVGITIVLYGWRISQWKLLKRERRKGTTLFSGVDQFSLTGPCQKLKTNRGRVYSLSNYSCTIFTKECIFCFLALQITIQFVLANIIGSAWKETNKTSRASR